MALFKSSGPGLLTLLLIGLGVWGWSQDLPRWHEIGLLLTQSQALNSTDQFILMQMRLPRIVLAALAGAGLSAAGLGLQGLFRNPLVDPFVLGISGGAALGAGVVLLLNLPQRLAGVSLMPLVAFSGALLTVALVYRLGQVRGRLLIDRLLLAGVALSALSSALLSLGLVLRGEGMETLIFWIMGGFAGRGWEDVLTLLPFTLIGCFLLLRELQALNVLQTGEESARYLGFDVHAIRNRVLLIASLLAAAVVAVSGIIGFVGLMMPHFSRFVCRSSDFRVIFPLSLFSGGALLILADGLARNLLTAQEIPVGIFTALLGVPFFLGLMLRQEN
jgi:iron complex transport system permease protein